MAHGTPRINICFDCNQYTLVSRFSKNPNYPTCGKESKQTTKDEIINLYQISIIDGWRLHFDHWEDITKLKRK